MIWRKQPKHELTRTISILHGQSSSIHGPFKQTKLGDNLVETDYQQIFFGRKFLVRAAASIVSCRDFAERQAQHQPLQQDQRSAHDNTRRSHL